MAVRSGLEQYLMDTANSLRVAAVQMDAWPAPTAERLARAAKLATETAASGAKLVLLSECFNTGFIFRPDNQKGVENEWSLWLVKQRQGCANVQPASPLPRMSYFLSAILLPAITTYV